MLSNIFGGSGGDEYIDHPTIKNISINLGSWNMESMSGSSTHTISSGLTDGVLVSMKAIIRDDGDFMTGKVSWFDFESGPGINITSSAGYIMKNDGLNGVNDITLFRTDLFWDSSILGTAFSDTMTVNNRGMLILSYAIN